MSAMKVIADLDAATYQRHATHAESCAWPEKNCYVDLWIELLHGLRLEPLAMLPFVVAVDFEGDTVALDRVADSMVGIVIGVAFGELAGARAWLGNARGSP